MVYKLTNILFHMLILNVNGLHIDKYIISYMLNVNGIQIDKYIISYTNIEHKGNHLACSVTM